jgi:hypothetical protein
MNLKERLEAKVAEWRERVADQNCGCNECRAIMLCAREIAALAAESSREAGTPGPTVPNLSSNLRAMAHARLDEARWWREQTARLATTALHLRIMNERVENLERAASAEPLSQRVEQQVCDAPSCEGEHFGPVHANEGEKTPVEGQPFETLEKLAGKWADHKPYRDDEYWEGVRACATELRKVLEVLAAARASSGIAGAVCEACQHDNHYGVHGAHSEQCKCWCNAQPTAVEAKESE